MGWINDTLNGKEKTVKKDALSGQINAAGASGLGMMTDAGSTLSNIYKQDPTQMVRNQIGIENKVARTAAEDATRRTQSLLAQRGMGTSSIGIGQQVNEKKSLMDRIGMNNASFLTRQRDAQIGNAQGLSNTGTGLYNLKASQGIQMTDQKYRTGGYGELIVGGAKAGASAYAGGA